MKHILAVVVLYRMPVLESPTCVGLQNALQQERFQQNLHLLIADNSPASQSLPPTLPATYLHDGTNPGLARRYNQALAQATEQGARWLLLFDQDTTVTGDYLDEAIARCEEFDSDPRVVAIVPKLRGHGRILSPHPPLYRPAIGLASHQCGLSSEPLCAFNSGALLRVSTLRLVNGFDESYSLDYLDHATFYRLQSTGGKVFVMDTCLAHNLSVANPAATLDPRRLFIRLEAERIFCTRHGSFKDNLLHRIDLIRQIIGWGRRGQFSQAWIRVRVLFHAR